MSMPGGRKPTSLTGGGRGQTRKFYTSELSSQASFPTPCPTPPGRPRLSTPCEACFSATWRTTSARRSRQSTARSNCCCPAPTARSTVNSGRSCSRCWRARARCARSSRMWPTWARSTAAAWSSPRRAWMSVAMLNELRTSIGETATKRGVVFTLDAPPRRDRHRERRAPSPPDRSPACSATRSRPPAAAAR